VPYVTRMLFVGTCQWAWQRAMCSPQSCIVPLIDNIPFFILASVKKVT